MLPRYRVLADHFTVLERVQQDCFESGEGPLRAPIRRTVGGFLNCDLLEHGFGRVNRGSWRAEFLVPFRCEERHLSLVVPLPAAGAAEPSRLAHAACLRAGGGWRAPGSADGDRVRADVRLGGADAGVTAFRVRRLPRTAHRGTRAGVAGGALQRACACGRVATALQR